MQWVNDFRNGNRESNGNGSLLVMAMLQRKYIFVGIFNTKNDVGRLHVAVTEGYQSMPSLS